MTKENVTKTQIETKLFHENLQNSSKIGKHAVHPVSTQVFNQTEESLRYIIREQIELQVNHTISQIRIQLLQQITSQYLEL